MQACVKREVVHLSILPLDNEMRCIYDSRHKQISNNDSYALGFKFSLTLIYLRLGMNGHKSTELMIFFLSILIHVKWEMRRKAHNSVGGIFLTS